MSKTAREVIAEQRVHGIGIAYRAEHIITALNAAGFVIAPKELLEKAAQEIRTQAGLAEGDRFVGNEMQDEIAAFLQPAAKE